MTHSAGGVQIAARGTGGSLLFFWAADGTSAWHPVQVAGPGTMQGTPAMVAGNNTMEIAITATDGSLRYYWAYDRYPHLDPGADRPARLRHQLPVHDPLARRHRDRRSRT